MSNVGEKTMIEGDKYISVGKIAQRKAGKKILVITKNMPYVET